MRKWEQGGDYFNDFISYSNEQGEDGGSGPMDWRIVSSDAAASGRRWGRGSGWGGRVEPIHFDWLDCLTAAGTKQLVREGDKTMLTCGNLNRNQAKCEATTWTFTDSGTRTTLELVTLGRVRQPRISLSEDCSLLIPEVRAEDAGVYFCQQFISGVRQLPDAPVYLSVVTCEYWHNNLTNNRQAQNRSIFTVFVWQL